MTATTPGWGAQTAWRRILGARERARGQMGPRFFQAASLEGEAGVEPPDAVQGDQVEQPLTSIRGGGGGATGTVGVIGTTGTGGSLGAVTGMGFSGAGVSTFSGVGGAGFPASGVGAGPPEIKSGIFKSLGGVGSGGRVSFLRVRRELSGCGGLEMMVTRGSKWLAPRRGRACGFDPRPGAFPSPRGLMIGR